MKRIICIILAFFALFTATASADGYFILCKPKSSVNARISARKRAETVGWYDCGDYVETDGKTRNGFAHIVNCSLEVNEAWISMRYLVKDKPVICEIKTVIIGSGRVAARGWVNGRRIAWLKPGQEVTVFAITEEWCVTDRGYIRTEFLGV